MAAAVNGTLAQQSRATHNFPSQRECNASACPYHWSIPASGGSQDVATQHCQGPPLKMTVWGPWCCIVTAPVFSTILKDEPKKRHRQVKPWRKRRTMDAGSCLP